MGARSEGTGHGGAGHGGSASGGWYGRAGGRSDHAFGGGYRFWEPAPALPEYRGYDEPPVFWQPQSFTLWDLFGLSAPRWDNDFSAYRNDGAMGFPSDYPVPRAFVPQGRWQPAGENKHIPRPSARERVPKRPVARTEAPRRPAKSPIVTEPLPPPVQREPGADAEQNAKTAPVAIEERHTPPAVEAPAAKDALAEPVQQTAATVEVAAPPPPAPWLPAFGWNLWTAVIAGAVGVLLWRLRPVQVLCECAAFGEYRVRLFGRFVWNCGCCAVAVAASWAWELAGRVCNAVADAASWSREWCRYAWWSCFSDRRLQGVLTGMNNRIEAAIKRIEILFDQADRFGTWPLMAWFGSLVRMYAQRRTKEAIARQNRLEGLKLLFDRITADREARRAEEQLRKAERLCADIGSNDDSAAAAALADLYRMRHLIDWDVLIPPHVAAASRRRVRLAYERLAGTTVLSEARNAYDFIKRTTGAT